MKEINIREMLENCHDVENQRAFINKRINELKKQIITTGDFGRTEIVNMFTQILVSIDNKINDQSFTAELIRKVSEWRNVCTKYTYYIDNSQRKLANVELFKLKKIGKEIDVLLSVKLGQVEDKK